jgi:putative tricarboxylic transport membrane protein
VVTVIDGYQMARKGPGGSGAGGCRLGSFFAGCVGTLVLAAFAVPLTEVAFKFGPAEYFSLMILGLIGAVVLASGSLLKAFGMILLGLLLGLVGTDVNSAWRVSALTSRTDRRHWLHCDRHGGVRLRRNHQQPGQTRERARGLYRQCEGPDAHQRGFQAHGAGRAAWHGAGVGAGHPARWWGVMAAFAAYTIEKEDQAQAR